MIVKAHLAAFRYEGEPVAVREIEIPEEDVRKIIGDNKTSVGTGFDLAELAFKYGQNDFQPRPMRSVSVDDVVEIPLYGRFLVEGVGFSYLVGSIEAHAAKVARKRGDY